MPAKKTPKDAKTVQLKNFKVYDRCEFWNGQYAGIWNKDIFGGTEAYYNVDLQLVVCKKPGKEDILIPVPGIMRMVPA